MDLLTGFPFKSAEYTEEDGNPKLLRGDNIAQGLTRWANVKRWPATRAGEVRKYELASGDVVLAMDRPWIEAGLKFARISDFDLPALLVQRVSRMRALPGLHSRFLHYVVSSEQFTNYVLAVQTGTAVPHISAQQIKSYEFRLPSFKEQTSIATLLGALDDKIDLNRRMNETLESMARAVFKDWFVDFGPTRAKADGRGPYLAPELWELFPDALDDKDRPEGWSFVPLSVIAEINPESWSRKNSPEDIEYVDLANTKWGTIQATRRFRWQDAPSRAKRILRPGDTIVGTVRPGNGSFAFIGDSDLTGSTGFAVLRPRQSRCAELVFLSATAPENIERLANLADGAAYPAVRPDVVGATEVVSCEDAVVTGFSALVSPLLDRIESNKRENRTLARTRDLLLPKLMSGEIRLSEAENAVGAVE